MALRLRGTESHPDAIGAIVTLHAGDRTLVRQVQAAGGYLAQSSLTVHFGLGGDKRVDRCEIRWPSGTTTTHANLPVDEHLLVMESGEIEIWER